MTTQHYFHMKYSLYLFANIYKLLKIIINIIKVCQEPWLCDNNLAPIE